MGYDDIPWIFCGRALYQLQLVKSKIARQYIPPKLKLVELFGHTLGGFYLARYTDSPAGAFDELVVMSGLVWNAPTSCAWAARVYVNNKEARNHGLKHVGLPSRLAQFIASPSRRLQSHWWKSYSPSPGALSVKNIERRGWLSKGRGLKPSVCTFLLDDDHSHDTKRGPRMKLTLPSFSGCTLEIPKLLKYACQLEMNIRPVRPMELRFDVDEDSENDELMKGVLQGRKVCAFVFDDMTMTVNPPIEIEYSQPPRHELVSLHF